MDMRFGLLFLFVLGADVRFTHLFLFAFAASRTSDAIDLQTTEVETFDSDAPVEIEQPFSNQPAQRNQSRVAQTSATPPSRGGRTGSLRQSCVRGWGRRSTQSVPPTIVEVRPAVPTPTPDVETSAKSAQAAVTRSQLVGQKRPTLEGGHSPNESACQCKVAQISASTSNHGGRTGSPRHACVREQGRGSTRPVPAITEVRPAVSTPTPVAETSAENNQAAATKSQLVGQKRTTLEEGHSPIESAEAHPRLESSGASSRLGYTMPPVRWGLPMPISDVPHLPQNSESLLYNPKLMSRDMGRNLDALQGTLAQVLGTLTCFSDQAAVNFAIMKNHLEETSRRLEAAERATAMAVAEKAAADHARITAEEEAATKVESLQAEHQTALSALKLEYDARIQEVEVSLAGLRARQEAVASGLVAVNAEPMNEADYIGQRYRRSAIFMIKERYPNLDLDGIDFESLRGAEDRMPEEQAAEPIVVLSDEDAAEDVPDSA